MSGERQAARRQTGAAAHGRRLDRAAAGQPDDRCPRRRIDHGLDQLAISFLGLQRGFDFALDAGRGTLTLSNRFLGLQRGFDFALDAGRGTLTLSNLNPVPVRAAQWLFAPAVALLGWRRREPVPA